MMTAYIALAAGILLGVVGQMLLKAGAEAGAGSVIQQFLAPSSVLGLGLYFAAAVCYMLALRKLPVSVAFPAVSLSYVVVAVAAYYLYGESLGALKLLGIACICVGVFLVVRTA